MAVLSDAERARIARWYQRDANMGAVTFTKPELVAAVAALDSFLDTNATALNNALPAAFRTKATTAQKALLLVYVVLRRWGGGMPIHGGD